MAVMHGLSNTPEYAAWAEMKKRCFLTTSKSYPRYGGRGITVCAEWLHDFPAFFHVVGRRPSATHSLDRINNNGNYEPGNVRWATKQEQAINRRTTYFLHNELARDVAIRNGLTPLQFRKRIHRGWPVESAATHPLVTVATYAFGGESHTIKEWALITGIKHGTLKSRLQERDWPIEKALTVPRRQYTASI